MKLRHEFVLKARHRPRLRAPDDRGWYVQDVVTEAAGTVSTSNLPILLRARIRASRLCPKLGSRSDRPRSRSRPTRREPRPLTPVLRVQCQAASVLERRLKSLVRDIEEKKPEELKIHVFIDTSTLEELRFDLDFAPLRRVLSAEAVVLHTTSVTLYELRSRMDTLLGQFNQVAGKLLKEPGKLRESETFLDCFRRRCAHVHEGRGVDLGMLVDLFTKCKPPFKKGKKREEFKDAIAVLALHHWAEREQKIIHIVADDSDWWDACNVEFPRFRKNNLDQITQELFTLDAQRFDVDTDEIACAVEGLDMDDFGDALRCVEPSDVAELQIDLSSVDSIQATVQKVRVSGPSFLVILSFKGTASVEVYDDQENGREIHVPISGEIEASFDRKLHLLDYGVIHWQAVVPVDLAALDITTPRLRPGDDS